MALFAFGLVVQGVIGLLGVYVTFRSPKAEQHRLFLGFFALLTVTSIGLAIGQQYRNDVNQARMQGRLDERLDQIDKTGKQIASDLREFMPKQAVAIASSAPPVNQVASRSSTVRATAPPKAPEQPASVPTTDVKGIENGIDELKRLIVGQRWGMSADQLVALSRQMMRFVPSHDRGDLITCVLGDPDSTKFTESLVAAFRSAGWMLPGTGYNQAIFSGSPEGVIVKLHSKESDPSGLREFVVALRASGIEPTGVVDDKIPTGEFQIIVGRKPS